MRFENASKRNQICPTRFRDKRETTELLPLSFFATKGKEEKQKPAQYLVDGERQLFFVMRERCCGAKKKEEEEKKREKKSGKKKMEEQKEQKREGTREGKGGKGGAFSHKIGKGGGHPHTQKYVWTTTTTTTKTKRIQTQTLSSSR